MITKPSADPELRGRSAGRAGARLAKALEVSVAEVGLSLPLYRLLAFLSGGPERAAALACRLEVSPPSLTALVDTAVNRALVERVAVQGDRRCVRHVLTDSGAQALVAADAAVAAKVAAIAAHLPADEAEAALRGLELMGRAIQLAHHAAGHHP